MSTSEDPPVLRELVVHVDSTANCAARVDLAAHAAEYLKAAVMGVYAQGPALMPLAGESLSGLQSGTVTTPESMQYNMHIARADAQSAEDLFRSRVALCGSATQWHVMAGRAADVLVAYARYADLVVVGQTIPGGDDVVGEVVLRSGRPVLIAPHVERFPVTMERVLLAWDASREAARALRDALPLLRRAKSITILSIGPTEKSPPGADITTYLSRHKAEAALLQEDAVGDAGAALLARARTLACDLIVMGAYGHSRLRERVLGGTTQYMMKHMSIPVLVSH